MPPCCFKPFVSSKGGHQVSNARSSPSRCSWDEAAPAKGRYDGGGGHAAAGTPGQGVQTPPVDGAEVPPLPSRMLPAIAMLAEHRFMASGGEGRGRGGGKQAPCLSPARGAVSPCTLRPRSSPCPLQPLGAPVPTATHPTASPCQASQPRSCCCRHGDPAQHPRAGDKPGAALRSASLINQC